MNREIQTLKDASDLIADLRLALETYHSQLTEREWTKFQEVLSRFDIRITINLENIDYCLNKAERD
jgi:hypothetical protein